MARAPRRTLRWLFRGLLVCAAAFVVTLWWVLRPEFLQPFLLARLAELSLPIEARHISLSLAGGIELYDVTIHAPRAEPRETKSDLTDQPGAAVVEGDDGGRRALIRVGSAWIGCDWPGLLRGSFHPREIVLRDVATRVVAGELATLLPPREDAHNAPQPYPAATLRKLLAREWPRMRIEGIDVQLLSDSGPRPRLLRRSRLDVTGEPRPDGYRAALSGLTTSGRPLIEAHWHAPSGELALSTDWLDLEALLPWLPEELQAHLHACAPRGRARVERAAYCVAPAPDRLGALHELGIQLDGVSAAYALRDEQAQVPAVAPYLRIDQVSGGFSYRPAEAAEAARVFVSLQGLLHNAPTTLRAALTGTALRDLVAGRIPSSAGVLWADCELRHLRFPTVEEDGAFVKAEQMPRALRHFLRDYRPRGPVTIRARAAPRADPDAPPVALIDFDAEDCALRYHRFPYDFHNVRGRVRMVNEEIFVEGLHGRHGPARARVDGYVSNTESWARLDLDVHVENIAFDEDLYRGLPKSYRRLWQSAAPLGLADAKIIIRRPEGEPHAGPAEVTTDVDLRLLRGSLWLDDTLRVENASGFVAVRDDGVTFHDLHGYVGGAAVRLSGRVGTEHSPPPVEIDLALLRWPVVRVANVAGGRLEFDGLVDVWGRVVREPGATPLESYFSARIGDGVLRGFDPRQAWKPMRGWVTIDAREQRLRGFRAAFEQAWIEAEGALPQAAAPASAEATARVSATPARAPHAATTAAGASAAGTGDIHAPPGFTLAALPEGLTLRAGGPDLAEVLRQFLPPEWAAQVSELALSGAGEVSAEVERSGPAASGDVATRIRFQAAQARPRHLPLDLRSLSCDARLRADGFEVLSAKAGLLGGGTVESSGVGIWKEGRETLDLRIAARDLEFSPTLLEGLPPALGRTLAALSPQGDFDAILERVRMESTPNGRTWDMSGQVALRNAVLDVGLPLEGATGELRGGGRVAANGDVAIDCRLSVQRAKLAGRPIEQLEARLLRVAGDSAIYLKDIRTRFCGGDTIADVRVDPATRNYEMKLTFQDVSMEAFFALADRSGARSATPRPGRLDGEIFLRGRGSEVAGRRGGGTLRVRGASIMQTPVLTAVAEKQTDRGARGGDEVDTADLLFTLDGQRLELQRVELLSRDLRLVGTGSWQLDNDAVSLTLVGAHPRNWRRVAVVSDLLERAGQELMQFRVEGTLDAPRVTAEPLRTVSESLRQLLGTR